MKYHYLEIPWFTVVHRNPNSFGFGNHTKWRSFRGSSAEVVTFNTAMNASLHSTKDAADSRAVADGCFEVYEGIPFRPFPHFSRMRSKGSRFTLGVWGLRVCSLDVASASATVRNRSCEDRMAVPMVSSAEVVIFGGFRRVVASFRVAGVALRDIQTCFATCWKSFCVAGAILLWRFQKMCCSFRGRRSTLDVSIVIFRGRRSTLDVSCCVFFVNRIGRAASSGDKVQIPWQAWHFLTCAENWRKPRTKHRFWGCKFSGSKENS